MVQQPRQDEPQYVCVISVESVTGNQDEELVTFGVSADDAKSKAEQLLVENYGCNKDEIYKLMQQAKLEPLSVWCSQPRVLLASGGRGGQEKAPVTFLSRLETANKRSVPH